MNDRMHRFDVMQDRSFVIVVLGGLFIETYPPLTVESVVDNTLVIGLGACFGGTLPESSLVVIKG